MQKPIQLLIGVALFASLACARNDKATLQPSDRAPAAKAEVEVEHLDESENAELDIELEHLPPPSELGADYTTFVVWLTPKGTDKPQNIGQLDYDPQSREGSLEVLTPYDQFSLAITAESVGNPVEQSDAVIASGDLNLRRYPR